jgi:toxin YoeB
MICFRDQAWKDYLYWQQTDKKILKRINILIMQCRYHYN